MKNEEMFAFINDSCTVSAPNVLSRLTFDAAEEYKNTVTPVKSSKGYVKAAAIYAAACLIVAMIIPFIIGKVGVPDNPPASTTAQPILPGVASTTQNDDTVPDQKTINAADINAVYNGVDPETLPEKVTLEEVEKIIAAARLAYDDYDVIILSDGTEITTDVKKPDINVDELEYIYKGEPVHEQYKEYFGRLYLIVKDAVLARFSERSAGVFSLDHPSITNKIIAPHITNKVYSTFCVTDIEGSGYENAGEVYDEMISSFLYLRNSNYQIADVIWLSGICDDEGCVEKVSFSSKDNADATANEMLFPTEEECTILAAELADERTVMIRKAFRKGLAEGRLPEIDYNKYEYFYDEVWDETSDTFVFRIDYRLLSYIYCEGDIYPIDIDLPVYLVSNVRECDPDRNGINDLLIYGTWGSGVYGFSVAYFDMNTKTILEIYVGSSQYLIIQNTTDDDGEPWYPVMVSYAFGEGLYYIGDLVYTDEGLTIELLDDIDSVLEDKTLLQGILIGVS